MDVTIYQRAFDDTGNPAAPIRRELSRVLRSLLSVGAAQLSDILLVVTELVTNVCLHASCSGDITVRHGDGVLTIDVTDRNPVAVPARRPVTVESPSGRGLAIVERLTTSCAVMIEPDRKRIVVQVPVAASR